MNRLKKLFFSTVLVFVLLACTYSSVLADTNPYNIGNIVDGSVLTQDGVSENTKYNPARSNILNRGTARISNNGDGTVNVYGAIMAGVVCDKLVLKMTLQRLEGNTWTTVKTYSDTDYNKASLSKSYNPSVTKGYYYRVKAACVATDGGVSESQMPITDGIWVD